MSLGVRVRYYREKLNLTLEALAERSGVEVGTINALENRKSTRSKYSPQLARAFGLTIEQLIDPDHDWLAEPKVASQSSAVVHIGEHPPKTYIEWPFPDIAPRDYFALAPEVRAEVQGFAKALLLRHKKIAAA